MRHQIALPLREEHIQMEKEQERGIKTEKKRKAHVLSHQDLKKVALLAA